MANWNITVELTPYYYTKINNYIYPQIINRILEESGEELVDYIKDEAPVRTGRLRDGHTLQKGNGWINITNEAYYWKYVVWRGNDYLNRGLLQFINDQIISEKTSEKLQEEGII